MAAPDPHSLTGQRDRATLELLYGANLRLAKPHAVTSPIAISGVTCCSSATAKAAKIASSRSAAQRQRRSLLLNWRPPSQLAVARLFMMSAVKDRQGWVTRYFYDRYGRRIATRDSAGRTVSIDWSGSGVVDGLIDAKSQRTTWERDVQGRTTREIRADGTTDTLYTYDPSGRLKTITDPMDQVTTYTYNTDDSLASTGFTNETIATPDISHTYDTYYPRPLTMVDGNGTTTYAYKAAGTNGAGRLASVDGPLSSDTITYSYDELGRVLTRLLNGTGTEITYDTLGRLSQLEFPIGVFDYTYAGHTGRVATVEYPNDQTSTYSYFSDQQDFRLQTIHHKNPSAATLSKFDYTYDDVGNILTWRQERGGSAAQIYTFTHDLVDQLTSAVLTDTNSTPTILKRQAWAYDVAGNRTVDQTDDAVFASTHNSLNRLGSRAPGGPIVLTGTLNEEGTVTIDGQSATVDAANNFRGTAVLSGATTTVTVKAKDYSGNETTKQYEVDASGSTTSYSYDSNGNLTSDGTKTYVWNALNRLVEVKEGTTTIATFEYDGFGRRTEKVAAGLTHAYIYDAEDIIEERITGSSSDTIRYYHGAGIDEPLARKSSSDVVTYYLADHLGSIVQESSAAGAITLEREYDPWGVAMQGASTSGYAFAGREWDAETQLHYYRARYYSPEHGRFMSDDPSGLSAGVNLLEYVGNSPAGRIDPLGLQWFRPPTEKPVFGRDGTWVEPDGAGQWVADNIPAMHTTSKLHDELLSDALPFLVRIGIPYETADKMLNYPTMPGTFIEAVIQETTKSTQHTINRVRDWWKPKDTTDGRTSCR